MDEMDNNQMISALADGGFGGQAREGALDALSRDAHALQAWQMYHLIGDVLRSPDLTGVTPSDAFVSRLSERLAAEPVVTARGSTPRRDDGTKVATEAVTHVGAHRAGAANDGVFQWKLVAGLASLAAVVAVGWTVAGALVSPTQPQLAAAPVMAQPGAVLTGNPRGTMIRDARLDELLAAHRQLGGATALQAPAGFLQNATFDSPTR